jgi:hypothetical protein
MDYMNCMNCAECVDCLNCMGYMNSADCMDCTDCEYCARLERGCEGAKAPKAGRAPEPAARSAIRGRRRAMGWKKDRRRTYSKSSRERCLLKRVTNKRVRKKLDVPCFAGYRRLLDFWWMLD